MTVLLNATQCAKTVVLMTKTGAWVIDCEIDLPLPIVPTGPCVVTLGTIPARGTIDDDASGRFGTKARVRVVGGGGGWDTPLPALQFHNDAGVLSTAVYSAIGAIVKEVVVELQPPRFLGSDFAFMRGAASRVFAGADWWVDLLGITHVGPRIPLPAPPLAAIVDWDPLNKVATIASDILIMPGMLLVDPIRGITATVDDVEHTFDAEGARAIAWCSTPSLAGAAASLVASPPATGGAKLVQGLGALAREACNVAKLKRYPYRVAVQVGNRLNLVATTLNGDAPKFLTLIDIWAGVPGVSVKVTPSTTVLVAFVDQGDPSKQQPVIVGFDPKAPPALEVAFDAIRIAMGAGTSPVALATNLLAWCLEVEGALTALGHSVVTKAALSGIASHKLFSE